jgi:hypothetical protein
MFSCGAAWQANATRFSTVGNAAEVVGQTPWSARDAFVPHLEQMGSASCRVRAGRRGRRPRSRGTAPRFMQAPSTGKTSGIGLPTCAAVGYRRRAAANAAVGRLPIGRRLTTCPASRQAANGTSLRVLWRGRSPGRSNAAARRKNAPTNGGMAAWKATLRCCDEVPPQESSRRAKKRMDSSTRSLLPVSMPHLFSWGFAGRRPIPTDSGFPANCAGNSCQAPDCGVFMAFRTCAARGPQTAFEEV